MEMKMRLAPAATKICFLLAGHFILASCLQPPKDHKLFFKSHHAYTGYQSITQLEREDKIILRRFIHGIATGLPFVESLDGGCQDPHQQRTYNQSYSAADCLRSAKGGGVCRTTLKDFIPDNLGITGISDRLKDLFSAIGLSRSCNYLSLAQDKAVDSIIRDGWDPIGRGYGIIAKAYDNMGMRMWIKYVQYTLMVILFLSVGQLITMGVYPDPSNKNYKEAKEICLSSIKLLESDDPEYFSVEITKADSRLMAGAVTLPSIEFACMQ